MIPYDKDFFTMGNVAFALKNINHPPVVGSYRLDKIFGDMTARWTDFPPASVTHYIRSLILLSACNRGKELLSFASMDARKILGTIKKTESPLKKQLLMVALITRSLEEKGGNPPIIIGGCALSYYAREVYFTADIDLAYSDREALNEVLASLGYEKRGRYWVNEELKMAIEVPASSLTGEESPVEVVEVGKGLRCWIIGIEDLLIDRLNASKHWKSEIDGEMVELLTKKYFNDLDWAYLEKRARSPENDTLKELLEFKKSARR